MKQQNDSLTDGHRREPPSDIAVSDIVKSNATPDRGQDLGRQDSQEISKSPFVLLKSKQQIFQPETVSHSKNSQNGAKVVDRLTSPKNNEPIPVSTNELFSVKDHIRSETTSFAKPSAGGTSGKGPLRLQPNQPSHDEQSQSTRRKNLTKQSKTVVFDSIPMPIDDKSSVSSQNKSLKSKKAANPNITVNQKNESQKSKEIQEWQDLQKQAEYSDPCLDNFPSLKDVFRQRLQFNNAAKHKKKLIEKKRGLDYLQGHFKKEKPFVNPKFKDNKRENQSYTRRETDTENKKDDEKEPTGWRKSLADYEREVHTIKDEYTFKAHGNKYKYSKRSLGMLDNKNKLRIAMVWLITWKWFDRFITALIMLNAIFLGLKDYKGEPGRIDVIINAAEPFFQYIFLIECICKVLAMGMFMGNRTYLQDGWNVMDFIVVVTSMLEQLPQMQNMSGLRTFRLFRPLRSLTTMPSMKLLIGTLLSSMGYLGGITGLAAFFFMIFAILGVSFWKGTIHFRCYETEWPLPDGSWKLIESDKRLCSDWRQCEVGYCQSVYEAQDKGYQLKPELWKNNDIPELNYGLTKFDNILWAFLTIFQCITEEGWSNIMDIYLDSLTPFLTKAYFCLVVITCSFFILNLTIAVMLMKYEDLDKKQSNSKHKEELRLLGQSINLPGPLIQFLIKQESIQLSTQARRMLKKEASFIQQLLTPKKYSVETSHSYYQNWIVKHCLNIAMNPYFDAFILFVIIMNTIFQSLDKYPPPQEWVLDFANKANLVFTSIFTIEVLVKMIGFGFKSFFKDKMNQFDLFIVLVSLTEMEISSTQSGGIFSALRAFRLFKIFKLFQVGDLRILIDSISFTITTIGDYVILLCLFMYVFSLLGMSFFAGKVTFDEDMNYLSKAEGGVSPRNNFDEVWWSLITIFQVLLGEGWNEIMYNCMRTIDSEFTVAIYFFILVIFGNVIMLNLFLAILLGNFEKARNFGQKKQVFEAFREIIANGKTLNQALDIILNDMSMYAKVKVLKWDEIMVNKIHKKGDTAIAQDLLEKEGIFLSDESDIDNDIYNPNISQRMIDLSYIDNESNHSGDEGDFKKSSKREDDKNTPQKRRRFYKKANVEPSPAKKDQAQGEQGKDKVADGKNDSAIIKDDKENSGAHNEKKSKANKYAQTLFKFHKFNPNLLRFKEMSRMYTINPSEPLKAILEKDFDLHKYEMDAFTEEDMICMQSGYFQETMEERQLLAGDKKKEPLPPISDTQTSINIDKYLLSGDFKKASIRQQELVQQSLQICEQQIKEKAEEQEYEEELAKLPKKQQIKKQKTRKKQNNLSLEQKLIKTSKPEKQQKKNQIESVGNYSKTMPKKLKPMDSITNTQLNIPSRSKTIQGDNHIEDSDQGSDGSCHSSDFENKSFCSKLFIKFKYSSLFVLHKDTRLRRFLLELSEPPENLEDFKQFEIQNHMLKHQHDKEYNFSDDFSRDSNISQNTDQTQKKMLGRTRNLYDSSRHKNSANQIEEDPDTVTNNGVLVTGGDDEDKEGTKKQHPSKIFENIVLVLIILSSISLAIDNPLNDPKGKKQHILTIVDVIFTLLFFIEATIKIFAKGFMFNELGPIEPYLKSYWNMLDAFVVLFSLIDLVMSLIGVDLTQLKSLKALRAFRALRPLRVIARDEGMRLVVNALLASLPSMTNVLMVFSLFILIFGVMGVGFFKGTFYHCQDKWDATDTIDLNQVDTMEDCLRLGGEWVNKDSNFDTPVSAMITLFQMTTTEGWVDVFRSGMDSRGIHLQPKQNSMIGFACLYFISFMIIGSQFIINLFVGVVIDNFNTIKEKEELGNMFVTEQQKSWIEMQKIGFNKSLKTKVNEPTDWRQKFFRLVKNKYFEGIIMVFIVANTVMMASQKFGMTDQHQQISNYSNVVFACVFNMEMVLKLIGLGETYFLDPWNKFDMVIVIGTDISFVIAAFGVGGSVTAAISVIRSVRVMRMVRLIKTSANVRLIFDTIMNILPQISNVMTLILLLLYIFAALSINLFATVMVPQNYLDEKNNFQSLGNALIIFLKFSTGEDWNLFMYELADKNAEYKGVKCMETQTYQQQQEDGLLGCGSGFAKPFFIMFTVVVTMLVLNLSVAAVIEGLDTAKKENMGIVEGDEITLLTQLWSDYDPYATGWITMTDLIFLLYELPPPLGRRLSIMQKMEDNTEDTKKSSGSRQQERYLVNEEKRIVMKKVEALDLLKGLKIRMYPDATKQIHYVDVFRALIKRIMDEKRIDYVLASNLNRKMNNMWIKKYSDVGQDDIGKHTTVREEQAGLIITRWAKKCLSQKHNLHQKKNEISKKRHQQQARNRSNKANQDGKVDDDQAKKKKQTYNDTLKEQAVIIYNIINQVDDSKSNESNDDLSKYQVKNEYSWKFQGGEKVLENINKDSESSDDGYKQNAEHIMNLEIEAEEQAKKRRRTQLGGNKLSNRDLFSMHHKNDQNDKKGSKPDPSPVIEKVFGKKQKNLNGEQANKHEDGESSDDDNNPANHIAINLGNLENGQMDIEAKLVFKLEDDDLKYGKRPERVKAKHEYFAKKEDYQRLEHDLQEQQTAKENANVVTQEQQDLTSYQQQELKLQKMVEKQKLQQVKKKQSQSIISKQMRPQIHRNQENFIHGSSGQTIEMDTSENARIDADLKERAPAQDLNIDGYDTFEDLKSCPQKDIKFNPARAMKKGDGKNKFKIENKFEPSRNRNGAVSTMKARPEHGGLQQFGAQHNNFMDEEKKAEKEEESAMYDKEQRNLKELIEDKNSKGKPIINDKNFPTDINIVDKEELIYQQNRIRKNNKNQEPFMMHQVMTHKDKPKPKEEEKKPESHGHGHSHGHAHGEGGGQGHGHGHGHGHGGFGIVNADDETMLEAQVNSAYQQALVELEFAIGFNDVVMDEADDSLCTDESMNDVG